MSVVNLTNTGNVTSMSSAFYNCVKMTNIPNLNYASCSSFYACFDNTSITGDIDLSFINGNLNANYSFGSMFNRCDEITNISNLNLAGIGVNKSISVYNMFNGCYNMQYVNNFYMTNIVSGSRMFQSCYNLKALKNCHITIKNGASSTTNMMFYMCTNLTEVPFSLIETLGGYNLSSMFYNCHNLEFPKSINITDRNLYYGLSSAFANCYRFNVNDIYFNANMYTNRSGGSLSTTFIGCTNLSHMNIHNHKNLASMSNTFQDCTKLHSLNFINCKMSNTGLYSLYGTFMNCHNLKSINNIIGINWANCNRFEYAFAGCKSLYDVSALNTFSCTDADYMFRRCTNLDNIPAITGDKVLWGRLFGTSEDAFNSSIQGYLPKLVNFGGFVNYGKAAAQQGTGYVNYFDLDLTPAPNLSYQSLINVINGVCNLYVASGTTPASPSGTVSQKLIMHTVQIQKLTEQDKTNISNKGWHLVEKSNSYPIFE